MIAETEIRLPADAYDDATECTNRLAHRLGVAAGAITHHVGVRHAVARITRAGIVDPENNYCFGEGGAGTFSDGKLYTRATKRGSIRDVLDVLVHHGAPPDVLINAHPHVGTNRLPQVVQALRATI